MPAQILVVEDESGIRELIQDALTEQGFEVKAARNALVANAAINERIPDLAIVDWMMPQLSGLELIRQLRREEATRQMPIIMLTARSTEDDTIQGLDAGADDYITKPFSTRELISRVKAMLRRSSNHTEHTVHTFGNLTLDVDAHRPNTNCCCFC